jgi:hypothetical protein
VRRWIPASGTIVKSAQREAGDLSPAKTIDILMARDPLSSRPNNNMSLA